MIDGMTRLTGLIGWPVMHSVSPAMHNAAFDALGLNYRYVPLPVKAADLGAAMDGLRALNFQGANVTVPHKQAVMAHTASLTQEAEAVGAVNTLVPDPNGESWHGDNTDARGFIEDLQAHEVDIEGRLCLVLGAGGGARAVVWALLERGASEIAIANRTPAHAAALVEALRPWHPDAAISIHALPQDIGALMRSKGQTAALIVNATPIGMWPHGSVSPWPKAVKMPRGITAYDLVYRPEWTQFLAQAQAAGGHGIGGLGMLVRQGAAAFTMWTGAPAPIDIMRQAAEEANT